VVQWGVDWIPINRDRLTTSEDQSDRRTWTDPQRSNLRPAVENPRPYRSIATNAIVALIDRRHTTCACRVTRRKRASRGETASTGCATQK
jgi:hypothetical protein